MFSTLHTNDASGALPRLLDMGAEPYLLASSITCIVAQRVVRKIHDDCKEAYVPDPQVLADMKKELGSLVAAKRRGQTYIKVKETLNAEMLATMAVLEFLK